MANSKVKKTLWNSDPFGQELSQKIRKDIFEKINPALVHKRFSWKDEILATIREDEFDACNSAAIFFTGGPIKIMNTKPSEGHIRVHGRGYYHHIGI